MFDKKKDLGTAILGHVTADGATHDSYDEGDDEAVLHTIAQLKAFRSYFIVAAAAVAGLVTPPDPVSMLALLVPMCVLYELGIWAAQVFIRHTQAPDAEASTEPAAGTAES